MVRGRSGTPPSILLDLTTREQRLNWGAAAIAIAFARLQRSVIRAFNGDRAYIPNSQIVAAIHSPRGFRQYTIELLATDAEAA